MECTDKQKNFRMVLKLLNEAEVNADGSPSELDRRFRRLERKKGSDHPALIQYNKVVRGAGDTVRSIIISANARLGLLENPQILRILDHDEMDIAEIGAGVDGDRARKQCFFVSYLIVIKVIPFLWGCFIPKFIRSYIIRQTLSLEAGCRYMLPSSSMNLPCARKWLIGHAGLFVICL